MSRTYRSLRHALALIVVAGLSVGCSVISQTKTVQASDTYQRWSGQMDHIPFLFHLPDGRLEAFDDHGNTWMAPAGEVEANDADRVEVYVGNFSGLSPSLCSGKPHEQAPAANAAGINVVSALCDQSRTVVSFGDHARPRALEARKAYIARTRHLLLNGIWKSVAQEPDPRPY